MKVGIPTIRRFGVELEGYVNNGDFYGDVDTNSSYWDVGEDGSLDSSTDCGTCDNGLVDCSICDGEGTIYDNDEDSYKCNTCGGTGRKACSDCEGQGYIDIYGIEARSEPLSDTTSIHEIYERLHENGWYVNQQAGLHVHVEANDYDREDFQKVLALMAGIEPVIYSMNDRHRLRGTSYSKPITRYRNDVSRVLSRPASFGYRFSPNDRYLGLNFESYSKHSTIEFRYFSPQKDSENVEYFVELATKIVDFAKHATMEQILVIVKHLIINRNNFDVLAETIQETLKLRFMPWNESSMYQYYDWFTLQEIEECEVGMGLVAPAAAISQVV